MWQTVISFDNRWLEKNGIYNSEDGFLDVRTLHEYTRVSVNAMLKKEGLETATWSAAIHYNTDNLHIHIATVEPIPTRPLITVKTVQFSAQWVKDNNIIQDEKVKLGKTVSAHRSSNYGYRSISNRLKRTLENEGYNTRFLGDYITVNSNGTIELSFNGKNDNLPYHSILIDEHTDYKGKFKQSSIKKCRSTMVNSIIDNEQTTTMMNDVIRNQFATSMKNMAFGDLEEYRSESYISAEVNEAAVTSEEIDFDGIINNRSSAIPKQSNKSKYWTPGFKEARELINAGIESKSDGSDLFAESLFSEALALLSYEIENGNDLAAFELGKYYAQGTLGEIDNALSQSYYQRAFEGFVSELESDEWLQHFIERDEFIKMKRFLPTDKFDKRMEQFDKQIESDYWLENYLCYKVGRMYLDGSGVEKNIDKGIEYLKQSNSPFADYTIGSLYYRGEDVEQNFQTAYDYFKKACNAEGQKPIPFALYNMAEMIEKNLITDSDYEVDDLYRLAFNEFVSADNTDPNDMIEYRIAKMLLDGKGTEQNTEKAEHYLRLSSLKGNTFAQTRLAAIYLESEDEEKAELAMNLLETAANNDNDNAMYHYAKLLLDKTSPYHDEDKGMKYLNMAIDKNNQFAQFKMGIILLDEDMPYYNIQDGIKLLEKSAEQHNQFAQYSLGTLYLRGEQIEQDINSAIKYLTDSAKQGNQYALYTLGKIYINDSDIQDIEKAIQYFIDSAEQGNPFAAYTLGKLYLDNSLIDPDEELSYKWYAAAYEGFREIAEDENAEPNDNVLYNLGIMSYKGLGVDSDINAAVKYLTSASELDNVFAQYQLGKLYYFGADGVEVNKDLAIDYLNKSAAQGNEYAKALLEWKPGGHSFMHFRNEQGFSERMVSLSSDMKMLFDRLANEHDHMLNQMVYNRLEKEKSKGEAIEQ